MAVELDITVAQAAMMPYRDESQRLFIANASDSLVEACADE